MADPATGGVRIRDEEVRRALARLSLFSAKQTRRALFDIGDDIVDSTRERFRREVDPLGRPWVVTRRKLRKPSSRILYRTGRLFKSIRRRVRGDALIVATWLRYGWVQHHGATDIGGRRRRRRRDDGGTSYKKRKPVDLPARPILGLTPRDAERAVDSVRRRQLDLWRGRRSGR